MKKLFVWLIAVALSLSLIACGGNSGGSSDGGGEAEPFVIGMLESTAFDAAFLPRNVTARRFIEACGGTLVTATAETSSAEGYLDAMEQMITAGAQAIVIGEVSIAAVPSFVNLCTDNGVYLVLTDSNIQEDSEIGQAIWDNEYYLGSVSKSEYQNGYEAASLVTNAGAKKVAVIGSSQDTGISAFNDRLEGWQTAIKDAGAEVVVEYADIMSLLSPAAGAEVANSFLAAYPDMDAIFCSLVTQYCLDGIVESVKASGRDVKLSGIDSTMNCGTYLDEGTIEGFTGGNFADDLLGCVLAANAIQGNRLSDKPVHLTSGFFVVDTPEKWDQFIDVLNNDGNVSVYSSEECRNMLVSNNADFNLDELIKLCNEYSLEDILARRAEYGMD